jgi:uncharacterized membrane protein
LTRAANFGKYYPFQPEFLKGEGAMEEKGKSSTGLEENVAGFFCYLLGFITGIVFLVVEKESRFVKFHAKQSTITFLGLFVIMLVIGWIPVLGILLFIFSLILWLMLMVKALRGEKYMLPIVGKLAEEKAGE